MGFATFFATFLLFVSGALAGMSLSNASAGLHLTSRGFYETSSMIWPLATTPEGLRNVVSFCFMNKDAKDKLEDEFLDATEEWIDALGGPASFHFGHNLVFQETKGLKGEERLCCLHWDDTISPPSYQSCTWNPEVAKDTLAIYKLTGNAHNSATPGYNPPVAGHYTRHVISLRPIGSSAHKDFYEWVHEIGHVLGLLHEHQRPDRDQHINYRCKLGQTFKETFEKARKDTENNGLSDAEIETRLCEDYKFQLKYRFNFGVNFGKELGPVTGAAFGDYDLKSIMHYDSMAGSMAPCPKNLGNCVLTAKDPNDPTLEYSIPTNTKISPGDAATIKARYPWLSGP